MNPFPFIFALGWIIAILHLLLSRQPATKARIIEILLLYQLVFTVGLGGLFAFYGHAFLSNEIAEYIGWPPGNPFQLEVAYANLSFGILGLLCIWFRGLFWAATIIGLSIWFWADAYEHLRQLMVYQNEAPGNAGLPLYTDIIVPIILITLLTGYLYGQANKQGLS